MEPPPNPPPAVPDELVEEILLRSPPDDPVRLVRAALVCKRWCRLVSGAGFRRRFLRFHRTPPMLGLLYDTGSRIRFVATSSFRVPHGDDRFWRAWRAIDARHGRVLLHARDTKLGEPLFAMWNPITGEWRSLLNLGNYLASCLKLRSWSAAVLCAGVACDHSDCHRRPFQVVIVSSNREQMDAFVYSSVTDEWRQPASSQLQYHGARFHLVASSAFVGSALYFVFGAGTKLLEYNLAAHKMSVIDLPPTFSEQYSVCITTQDGRLGFARTEDSKLHLWSREAGHDGDAGWTQSRVIELERLLPVASRLSMPLDVVAFADGVGVYSVGTGGRLFTIDLKSSQVKKVCNVPGNGTSIIFPYMSFFTPALAAVTDQE